MLATIVPAPSAVTGNDSMGTLTNMLSDLRQAYVSAVGADSVLAIAPQHKARLAEMVKAADELTVRLYTQRSAFSFETAFALEAISSLQDSFREEVVFANRFLSNSRAGLRRFTLLDENIRDMYLYQPPDTILLADSLLLELPRPVPLEEEDPEKKALVDSCLYYTHALTTLYKESTATALQDSLYYAETEKRLRLAYDYARDSYSESQRNQYFGSNMNIVSIIKHWDSYSHYAIDDFRTRYFSDSAPLFSKPDGDKKETLHTWSGGYVLNYAILALILLVSSFLLAWLVSLLVTRFIRNGKFLAFRPIWSAILAILLFAVGMLCFRRNGDGPYFRMANQLLSQFSWLTLAILVSLLIRIQPGQAKASRNIYIPTLLLAFLSILARSFFFPASMVPIVFPPVLLVFLIWQVLTNIRHRKQVSRADFRYMWVSAGIMAVVGILSLAGYSMIGVLILTFWTFQLALLHTITTLYYLIKLYYDKRVSGRKARYHQENPYMPLEDPNAFIEVTWIYDLLRMVVIPLITLFSFPVSILLTSHAYLLSLGGNGLMQHVFFKDPNLQHLTLSNILIVISLFFIFRYLIYLIRAATRVNKLRRLIEKSGPMDAPLKESDVHLTLPNTIFTLLGWLLYLVIAFSILHVPTKAITAIITGLAAGVGFALKDLINNFFYGLQLMAGRIKVGDKISCDGVRGIVKRISYQTTQVEDEDGSLIAFTNTELFTKKFRNLNSGRNYELLKIPIGVSYGTDIETARKIILDAIKPLMITDKSGRKVVDPDFPIDIRVVEFTNNSVNLEVVLYTTVDRHYTFPARAKEMIYRAFRENGISFPFSQHDVYIKEPPVKK